MNLLNKVLRIELLAILLAIGVNSHAQSEPAPKYELLIAGMSDPYYFWARKIVGEDWNISYTSVSGCMINEELYDSVIKRNEETYKLISDQYGPEWKVEYNSEIDSVLDVHNLIRSLVRSEPEVRRRDSLLALKGNLIRIYPTPTKDENVYKMSLTGWGKWNDSIIELVYFEVEVLLKERDVVIVNSEIHPKEIKRNANKK